MYSPNPRAKRVRVSHAGPLVQRILITFAAMLMAGLDGIEKRSDPGEPIDKNLYDLPPAEAKAVKSTPGSLQQALDALEADHGFLLRGDVSTKDVIETWLSYKRKKEVDAIALRPHPYEFPSSLRYLDCALSLNRPPGRETPVSALDVRGEIISPYGANASAPKFERGA